MTTPRSAAVSHIGKIRSSNQDSGYAGTHLFLVADGMGGHAGGDVASAIAAKSVSSADVPYASAEEAEVALAAAFINANTRLTEAVFDHRELTGMGTTMSGIIRVGERIALAHIGDSRVYRYRHRVLEQMTTDHTFVQRLVETGRITPEEAAVHPRRSVLMRVLGDVDATPEVDTKILDTRPGDRWLLCSDGLCGYVSDEEISRVLAVAPTPQAAADQLIREGLDHGAPDNITVVVLDVDADEVHPAPPLMVGSAAEPLSFESEAVRRPLRLPTLLLHPIKATQPEDSHFEPEREGYLEEIIEEDRRRAIRRRVVALVLLLLAVGAIVMVLFFAYRWTQSHYYVGEQDGRVTVFQGVQATIGPMELSQVYQTTTIDVADLPYYQQEQLVDTINAGSLRDALDIVDRLQKSAEAAP